MPNSSQNKILSFLSHLSRLLALTGQALKACLALFCAFAALILGLGLGYLLGLTEDAPIPSRQEMAQAMVNTEEPSQLLSQDGQVIAQVQPDIRRENIPLDQVNPLIVNGLVATEDEHFFDHPGFVPSAIIRAAASYLFGIGNPSGGSTLSQQLIKQTLLTNEVSLARKAKELLLAIRLEKFFTKEQILEAYLNFSSFGRNARGENVAGIEAASQGLFGKKAADVNIPQAAFLVGLAQNPYSYTPYQQNGKFKPEEQMKLGIDRMTEVLERMRIEEVISEEEFQAAKTYDIRQDFIPSEEKAPESQDPNSFLFQALKRESLFILTQSLAEARGEDWEAVKKQPERLANYYDEAEQAFKNRGLEIQSTVQLDLHQTLEAKLQQNAGRLGSPRQGDIVQNGAVLIDNHTGAILAFTAGVDYSKQQTDHAFSTRRSPGSTIKPLLTYGPALQEGLISPATRLADNYIRTQEEDGSYYEPSNYGQTISNQIVTARQALAQSLNNPTVHLYQTLVQEGADLKSYMDNLGLGQAIGDHEYQNLALSLGGTQTGPTVAEMAAAYAAIANGGIYHKPHLIQSIRDRDGKLYYQAQSENKRAFNSDVAYILADMLKSVKIEGLWQDHQEALPADLDWLVKTGTSEGYIDSWVVGSTPAVSLASWIGYDNPSIQQSLDQADDNQAFGRPSDRHAKYWLSAMNTLYANNAQLLGAGQHFDRPDSVREFSIVEKTGQAAGDFPGPYQSRYHIPAEEAKKTELFPQNMPLPNASFNYAIGAELDELAFELEDYRIKDSDATNQRFRSILQSYRRRLERAFNRPFNAIKGIKEKEDQASSDRSNASEAA
ncbi:transglycosylase domain-containing protein [Aerococcus sanguinicola]|uniref:transglycosylase domain-containing protein n=1 Tax=Aerococcus sanguinicola TaxID=119206 RepID=UPI0018A7E1C2|nr:transglycosylase domain-containing protein [Aerococcus sanguinicola]